MATEFLHLPKIPLRPTPAREGGPHAQAVTNQLGFLSPGAALTCSADPRYRNCPLAQWVNIARQLLVLSQRLEAKHPLILLVTKGII